MIDAFGSAHDAFAIVPESHSATRLVPPTSLQMPLSHLNRSIDYRT
jgi:hypothetical protein